MVRLVVISMTPLVRMMGEAGGQDTKKVMVSPEAALATAERSEPEPESLQLVTDTVAAPAICAGRIATDNVVTAVARIARGSRGARREMVERRRPWGRARPKDGFAAQSLSATDLFTSAPRGRLSGQKNTSSVRPTTYSVGKDRAPWHRQI